VAGCEGSTEGRESHLPPLRIITPNGNLRLVAFTGGYATDASSPAFDCLTILARKPGDDVMARASAGRVWDLPVPVAPERSGGSEMPVDPSDEVVDGITPAAPTTLAEVDGRSGRRLTSRGCCQRLHGWRPCPLHSLAATS
jgi:hypothetical protein